MYGFICVYILRVSVSVCVLGMVVVYGYMLTWLCGSVHHPIVGEAAKSTNGYSGSFLHQESKHPALGSTPCGGEVLHFRLKDVSHETPDVIPCRTSTPMPVFVHTSCEMPVVKP